MLCLCCVTDFSLEKTTHRTPTLAPYTLTTPLQTKAVVRTSIQFSELTAWGRAGLLTGIRVGVT